MNRKYFLFLFLLLVLPIVYSVNSFTENFPNSYNNGPMGSLPICNSSTPIKTNESYTGIHKWYLCRSEYVSTPNNLVISDYWQYQFSKTKQMIDDSTLDKYNANIFFIHNLTENLELTNNFTVYLTSNQSTLTDDLEVCIALLNTSLNNGSYFCTFNNNNNYWADPNQGYFQGNYYANGIGQLLLKAVSPTVTSATISQSQYLGTWDAIMFSVTSGSPISYFDGFGINHQVYLYNNTYPNVTLNVSPKVQCLNESFLESVTFNLDINATDLEGDTVYYATDTKGFDTGLFGATFAGDMNYYYFGNSYAMPILWSNQSWGQGLTQQQMGGNFTNGGVLVFNYNTFPASLNKNDYGITYEIEPKSYNPRIFFKLYLNNLAQFSVRILDDFLQPIFTLNLTDTGIPAARSNETSNLGVVFNQSYSYMTQFMLNFSDTELKLYVCDPDLGCNEENVNEYVLVNTTTIGNTKFKYVDFTVLNGGVFLDDLFFTYEQATPTGWSTVKPTTATYNYPGIFRYKIYVTDNVHLNTQFSSDYLYLEVKECSEFIPDIEDGKVTGLLNFFKNNIGFFFKAVGEDISNTLLWVTFFMLTLAGIIAMYGATQQILLTGPILSAAVLCFLIAYLGSLSGPMIAFLVIIGLTIAAPMARNFIGGNL